MRKGKIIATTASVAAILAMAGAPAAMAAPTDDMDITLKAAPGNTLVGHTFKFYKLANYGDLSMNNEKTKVTGFSATAPDEKAETWAKNAISYYNEKYHSADDVNIPTGYDAAGAIVNLSTAANSAHLTGVVRELADTTNGLTPVKEVTPTAGQKDSLNVDVPEGVYLIVDSQGMPLLAGTQVRVDDDNDRRTLDVSSRDGDTNAVTVSHVVTIKSKIASMDKKISDEANKADDPADKDNTAVTVGATYNFQADTTVPSNRTGAFKSYTLTDTPSGMEIVKGSVSVSVKGNNGAYTPVALDSSSIKYEGNDVPAHGFVIDGAKLLADHADKQIRVTYKAKITGKPISSNDKTDGLVSVNVITASVVGKDGRTATSDAQGGQDIVTMKTARFTLLKTNVTTAAKPDPVTLNGAEFTISHANGDVAGTGMVFDKATGQWSDATSDTPATVFKTGDTDGDGSLSNAENKTPTGVINFEGLGVGEYIVTETKAPEGYLNGDGDRPSFKVTVEALKDGTPILRFKGLGKNADLVDDITPNSTGTNGSGANSVEVANAAKFSELPSTGELAKTGAVVGFSIVLVAAGAGLYMMVKRRESTSGVAGVQAA